MIRKIKIKIYSSKDAVDTDEGGRRDNLEGGELTLI